MGVLPKTGGTPPHAVQGCSEQIALEGLDLPRTYLAQHELESLLLLSLSLLRCAHDTCLALSTVPDVCPTVFEILSSPSYQAGAHGCFVQTDTVTTFSVHGLCLCKAACDLVKPRPAL